MKNFLKRLDEGFECAIDKIYNVFDTLEDFINPDFNRFYDRLSQTDKKVFLDAVERLKDGESAEVKLNKQNYIISR